MGGRVSQDHPPVSAAGHHGLDDVASPERAREVGKLAVDPRGHNVTVTTIKISSGGPRRHLALDPLAFAVEDTHGHSHLLIDYARSGTARARCYPLPAPCRVRPKPCREEYSCDGNTLGFPRGSPAGRTYGPIARQRRPQKTAAMISAASSASNDEAAYRERPIPKRQRPGSES